MKNRSANQLISAIVLTSLVIGTLPVHLPLSGKNPAPQEIKNEIKQKIKTVNTAVNRLKVARVFAPIMIIGAGIAFATIVIAGAIGLGVLIKKTAFLFPKIKDVIKKLKDEIKQIKKNIFDKEEKILEGKLFKETYEIYHKIKTGTTSLELLYKFQIVLKKTATLDEILSELHTKRYQSISYSTIEKALKRIKNIQTSLEKKPVSEILKFSEGYVPRIKALTKKLEKTKPMLKQDLTTNLEKLRLKQKQLASKIKTAIGALSFGTIGIALAGFLGSIALSLWPIFGLSAALVNKASKEVAWFEQIKKEYPGILTPQQEQSLKKFKKLAKDTKVQAIIQNLRLETARDDAIAAQMSKYAVLFAELGKKRARKLFLNYFKLKGEESIFQKAIAEDEKTAALLGMKRKLKTVQEKINKIERKHASLKQALRDAFQTYEEQANILLEELKKEILEAQKKKSKLQIEPLPVIQLSTLY